MYAQKAYMCVHVQTCTEDTHASVCKCSVHTTSKQTWLHVSSCVYVHTTSKQTVVACGVLMSIQRNVYTCQDDTHIDIHDTDMDTRTCGLCASNHVGMCVEVWMCAGDHVGMCVSRCGCAQVITWVCVCRGVDVRR